MNGEDLEMCVKEREEYYAKRAVELQMIQDEYAKSIGYDSDDDDDITDQWIKYLDENVDKLYENVNKLYEITGNLHETQNKIMSRLDDNNQPTTSVNQNINSVSPFIIMNSNSQSQINAATVTQICLTDNQFKEFLKTVEDALKK